MEKEITEEEAIIDFIRNHKESFQLNFTLIKTRPKSAAGTAKKLSSARMINIDKYQTKEVIIDFFYKRISRTLE